jgi:hypothetical protein
MKGSRKETICTCETPKCDAAAKESGVPVGALCGRSQVEKRLAHGFRFLAVGSDSGPSGSVRDAVNTGRAFKGK